MVPSEVPGRRGRPAPQPESRSLDRYGRVPGAVLRVCPEIFTPFGHELRAHEAWSPP